MRPGIQRIAIVVAILLSAGAISGCGSLGRSLSHRELVVIFVTDHTPADVERVRVSCDGVAGAKAVPAARDTAVNRRYPLRFDVSGLDLQQRSKLAACLAKDHAVRGYTDSESTSGS